MSTHKYLSVNPSEPNEEYYQETSHDEAFTKTGVLLSVLAGRVNLIPVSYFQRRAKHLAQMALGVDSNIRRKPLISTWKGQWRLKPEAVVQNLRDVHQLVAEAPLMGGNTSAKSNKPTTAK